MLPKTLNYSSLTTLLNYKPKQVVFDNGLDVCTFNVKGLPIEVNAYVYLNG